VTFEIGLCKRTYRQTYRHTDSLITILCTLTEGEVNIEIIFI